MREVYTEVYTGTGAALPIEIGFQPSYCEILTKTGGLVAMWHDSEPTYTRVLNPYVDRLLDDAAPRPAPSAHLDMQDCGYCPLLATALLAVVWFAIARLLPVAHRAPVARVFRLEERHPCGLGSRGPPLAA